MALKDSIKPISYLKAHPAELVEQVSRTREAVIVTQNGEPRAVLQDIESYERMRRAIAILKLAAQSEAEIRAGKGIPQKEVFARVKKRFGG